MNITMTKMTDAEKIMQLIAFAKYAVRNPIEPGDLDIYAASQLDCELYNELFPGGCSCENCEGEA